MMSKKRAAWAALVPVTAAAGLAVVAAQPAAAAAQDIPTCVKLVVDRDGGPSRLAFRTPVWTSFFDATGNAIGSGACFDTVHVDSIRIGNGPCRAAGFHDDAAGAGWNRRNVARSVRVGVVASPGADVRVRFYNTSDCNDLMADRRLVRVATSPSAFVYRTA